MGSGGWIKDALAARSNPRPSPPLTFYGRAVQYYHNGSFNRGRRVERATIEPPFGQIAITMRLSRAAQLETPDKRLLPRPGTTLYIVAIELFNMDQKDKKTVLGSRGKISKTVDPEHVKTELKIYGLRVLFDARNFQRFRLICENEKILFLEVLRENDDVRLLQNGGYIQYSYAQDTHFCHPFDMRSDEVAATFEGDVLMDLGIRGHDGSSVTPAVASI
ncbi:hypothetical protein BDW69DRAFT_185099 [Aspergillus filifer]